MPPTLVPDNCAAIFFHPDGHAELALVSQSDNDDALPQNVAATVTACLLRSGHPLLDEFAEKLFKGVGA